MTEDLMFKLIFTYAIVVVGLFICGMIYGWPLTLIPVFLAPAFVFAIIAIWMLL